MLLSPVITALALLVLCFLGWPVLFHQQRPSLGGRPFMLHKFRTMSDERDDDGQLAPDARRLGGFGKFLRSTSSSSNFGPFSDFSSDGCFDSGSRLCFRGWPLRVVVVRF